MISTHHDELQKVIASVADWPALDRITLARTILETVEETTTPATGGLRGEEVIKLLQIPQPAPDDDECNRIVLEERLRKYGRCKCCWISTWFWMSFRIGKLGN